MKKLTILFGIIFLFSISSSFAQETKYAYGVVIGNATVYGEYNIFMYYTKIDEVNCYISRSDAEKQLKESFKNITSRWDGARFTVNFFDSYSEAENFKNQNINKAKNQRKVTLADKNIRFNFNCSN